ncbi:hypothetical protein ZWY2020_021103 [Hordeum vulgare]|nr:hypothetical protein ZWY2020_021103 [Hordeum vulgare]
MQLDEYVINMVGGRRRKGGGGRTRTPPAHAPSPAPIEHHPPHAQLDLDRATAVSYGVPVRRLAGAGARRRLVMAFARLENSRVKQRRELVRPLPPPPRFQFLWGYHNLSVVEDVVENYRSAQIPLDVIWNDDDHMDARKDFTLIPVNYPCPKLLAFLDMLQFDCL